jgi:hypothetical protein
MNGRPQDPIFLILSGCECISDLILRSREAASRRMAAGTGVATILRDAAYRPLLRMRSENVSQPLRRCVSAVSKDGSKLPWFETRQRVRAKRGPMINSDALLTMRSEVCLST